VQFPIHIGLRRSRILVTVLIVIVLSVLGVGFYFLAYWPLKWVLCLLVGCFALITWQKIKPEVSEIRLEREGGISIRSGAQQAFSLAFIQPNATVHPWLTVFRLSAENGKVFTLIATVDTLNQQDFRRLRVFLRWRADFSNVAGRDVV
jgi:hypothetical protein